MFIKLKLTLKLKPEIVHSCSLIVPDVTTKTSRDASFSDYAPKIWNILVLNIRPAG